MAYLLNKYNFQYTCKARSIKYIHGKYCIEKVLEISTFWQLNLNTTKLQTTMTYWLCEENKTAWNKGFKTIHTIIKPISIEFHFNRFQLVTTTSISDPTFVLPRSSKSIADHFFRPPTRETCLTDSERNNSL